MIRGVALRRHVKVRLQLACTDSRGQGEATFRKCRKWEPLISHLRLIYILIYISPGVPAGESFRTTGRGAVCIILLSAVTPFSTSSYRPVGTLNIGYTRPDQTIISCLTSLYNRKHNLPTSFFSGMPSTSTLMFRNKKKIGPFSKSTISAQPADLVGAVDIASLLSDEMAPTTSHPSIHMLGSVERLEGKTNISYWYLDITTHFLLFLSSIQTLLHVC
ncbi:hypothetical protein BDD12DRAFT_253855 [Trichophaea hybrida]|nr:hypothetical protein BDD12DRAFT_253855 [Trichophaea hybrida]